MAFLEWLQGTWVGLLVAESLWGYPLLETIHSIGMAMLIGSLGLINLRVLGVQARACRCSACASCCRSPGSDSR